MITLIILLISLLAGRSVGSEVNDRTNQTEATVSECVRWKWGFWVSFFDVNGDGIISMDDFNKAWNTYSQLHNLTGEDQKIREGEFSQWWTWMILWNKTEITTKEFVDLQSSAFLDDKEKFVDKMRNMMAQRAHFNDVDSDGYISEEEGMIYMKAIGLTNNTQDKDFFIRLHPEEKGVPLGAMTNYWVTYLTEDDCSETKNDDPMINLGETS